MASLAPVLLLIVLFALFCDVNGHQQTVNNGSDTWNIRRHLNTKSPYWTTYDGNSTAPPQGDVKKLTALQKLLQSNGVAITNPDYFWMRNWTNPYFAETAGLLTDEGEQEHYDIARRYRERFGVLLTQKYLPMLYPIQTTQVERAARSGNAFGYGMWEGAGHLGPNKYEAFYTYSNSLDEDIQLRFFDNCPLYETDVADNDTLLFDSEQYLKIFMNDIIGRVTNVLGISNSSNFQLTTDVINTLMKACSFDVAVFNDTDHFCSLFTEDDLEVFEYASDLEDYYVLSYGTKLASEMGCPLLVDFFNVMDSVINHTVQQYAYYRFAHAETVMPFVTLLGLYKDAEHLHWNSSDSVINNRQWRTSNVSPFAANVAFVLYNCSGQYRVQLLHNEAETEFPGCGELFCPYDKLKTLYASKLNCNFHQMCYPVNPTTTGATTTATTGSVCPVCPDNTTGGSGWTTAVIVGVVAFLIGAVLVFIIARLYWRKLTSSSKLYHRILT